MKRPDPHDYFEYFGGYRQVDDPKSIMKYVKAMEKWADETQARLRIISTELK